MTKIIGIVAVDGEYGIGNEGKVLPFPREDIKHFQETIQDSFIVTSGHGFKQMSKKYGKFYVYSRNPEQYQEGLNVNRACSSIRYLVNMAKLAALRAKKNVFITSPRAYEACKDVIDEWIITVDNAVHNSDTKLPWIKDILDGKDFRLRLNKQLTGNCSVYYMERIK